MQLVSVTNPVTQVAYNFPTAKQKVTTSDQRRVSLQHVPGADGSYSQYGLNPFPRGETTVTVSFRVTPRQNKTTFDALRNSLNLAVDHGLPQTLTFLDGFKNHWYATGWLTAKNLEANEDREWFADWSLTFVLQDPLGYGQLGGVNIWGGQGMTWGGTGLKWGATQITYALNASSQTYVISNPSATAETRDMIFHFVGQWGTAISGGTGAFAVYNNDVIDPNTGGPVQFWINDNIPAGTTYQIDCGSGGVYKNSTPMISVLGKPVNQLGLMRFRPGSNTLVFYVGGSAPISPMNGSVVISWRPKTSLS